MLEVASIFFHSHLQLEARRVHPIPLVLPDKVEDGLLLLPGVRALQLVEGAEVQDRGLVQQQRGVGRDLRLQEGQPVPELPQIEVADSEVVDHGGVGAVELVGVLQGAHGGGEVVLGDGDESEVQELVALLLRSEAGSALPQLVGLGKAAFRALQVTLRKMALSKVVLSK